MFPKRTWFFWKPKDSAIEIPMDHLGFIPTRDEFEAQVELARQFYSEVAPEDIDEHNEQRRISTSGEMQAGVVYVVQDQNMDYKIGQTIRLDQRLKDLAKKYGALKFILALDTADPSSLEATLHNHFAHRQIKYEWFQLTDEDIETIRTWRIGS